MTDIDVAALADGYTAFGDLLADNPHLTSMAYGSPATGTLRIYLWTGNIREQILTFADAFRRAGWNLREIATGRHAGIEARLLGLIVEVYTDAEKLAEPASPTPRPKYAPLLADEPTGGAA